MNYTYKEPSHATYKLRFLLIWNHKMMQKNAPRPSFFVPINKGLHLKVKVTAHLHTDMKVCV